MRYRTALILAAALGAASLYTPAANAGVWVGAPVPVYAPPAVVLPAPALGLSPAVTRTRGACATPKGRRRSGGPHVPRRPWRCVYPSRD